MNNVKSVIVENDKYKDRKTIFPETITDASLQSLLQLLSQKGLVYAQTKTIKYIQNPWNNMVVGIAEKPLGNIVTVYPVLRYIRLNETQVEDEKNVLLYVATAIVKNGTRWHIYWI